MVWVLPEAFFKTLPLTMISFHLLQTKLARQMSLNLRSLSIFSSISGGKTMLICSSGILFLSPLLILENWFNILLSLVTKSPNVFTVKSKVFEFTILLEVRIQVWCYLVKGFLQTSQVICCRYFCCFAKRKWNLNLISYHVENFNSTLIKNAYKLSYCWRFLWWNLKDCGMIAVN